MKKIVRIETTFPCSVCKTEYHKRRDAKECKKRKLEKIKFKIGDLVFAHEPRQCNSKTYKVRGKVVKILGPQASDEEYEAKWLGELSERLNSHVFQYEVKYTCPICKEKKSMVYYAPEIDKITSTK